MKAIDKIKEHSWIILVVLMGFLFLRQCGMNRDVDKIQKDIRKTEAFADSTYKEIKKITVITKEEVREEMKQVMFQYLIYEDDLDKGKISLSEIKDRIEKE